LKCRGWKALEAEKRGEILEEKGSLAHVRKKLENIFCCENRKIENMRKEGGSL